jgi:phage shock protein A
MSTKGEQDRERLKEEYKDHYRRIKEAKERLKKAEQKGKISQAVQNMNADGLLESVDEFLGKVRDKVTHVEARLEVAMDSLEDEDSTAASKIKKEELDEELKKQKAKQTLKQVKAEMGMLYNEIEKHADEIRTEKTIGNKKSSSESTDNSSDTKS